MSLAQLASGLGLLGTGAGRWILFASRAVDRLEAAVFTGRTIKQARWYVDEINGSDDNSGAENAPLKTLAELATRWSGKALDPTIVTAEIFLLSGSFSGALALRFLISYGQTLNIRGSMEDVATGTVVTYAARDPSTDASATILADLSFAGLAKKRIRMTSGAALGATATVLFDLGGNTCRVSQFALENGASATPANGDTFVVEDWVSKVPTVTVSSDGGGVVKVYDLETTSPNLNLPCYISPAFHIAPSSATFAANTGTFVGCKFSGLTSFLYGSTFYNCTFVGVMAMRGGRNLIKYASFVDCGGGISLADASLEVKGLICWDGCNNHAFDLLVGSRVVQNADLQFFRCNQGGIFLTAGSVLQQGSSVYVFGDDNTFSGPAVEVNAGSAFIYKNLPTILGSVPGTNDFEVGGAPHGWVSAPQVNPANNAMLVLQQ